jgi:hypothetical protein
VRPLSDLQRTMLVTNVARTLAWATLSSDDQNRYQQRARWVVQSLEDLAVHGASTKRGAETVLTGLPPEA